MPTKIIRKITVALSLLAISTLLLNTMFESQSIASGPVQDIIESAILRNYLLSDVTSFELLPDEVKNERMNQYINDALMQLGGVHLTNDERAKENQKLKQILVKIGTDLRKVRLRDPNENKLHEQIRFYSELKKQCEYLILTDRDLLESEKKSLQSIADYSRLRLSGYSELDRRIVFIDGGNPPNLSSSVDRTALVYLEELFKKQDSFQELIWLFRRAGKFQMADQEERRLETSLRNSRVISAIKSETGAKGSWVVELEGGITALFKTMSVPYELAVYSFDRALGLDLIPMVVSREINGEKGILQVFIKNTRTGYLRRFPWLTDIRSRRYPALSPKLRLLDFLVGNSDRNELNYLIRSNGQQIAIDHSRTLRGDIGFVKNPDSGFVLFQDVIQEVRSYPKRFYPGDSIYSRLRDLTDEEIRSLLLAPFEEENLNLGFLDLEVRGLDKKASLLKGIQDVLERRRLFLGEVNKHGIYTNSTSPAKEAIGYKDEL